MLLAVFFRSQKHLHIHVEVPRVDYEKLADHVVEAVQCRPRGVLYGNIIPDHL